MSSHMLAHNKAGCRSPVTDSTCFANCRQPAYRTGKPLGRGTPTQNPLDATWTSAVERWRDKDSSPIIDKEEQMTAEYVIDLSIP